MKQSLSSMDLRYLVKEFQSLISAKVVKIYHPSKREIVLQLHIPNTGKKILRVMIPNFMYMTDFKAEYPESPSGFCMFLRKRLNNSRIRNITQKGFERILEIEFETKSDYFILIIEMFSKGNIVLCDKDYNIIGVLEVQRWSSREVKPKVKYIFPGREDITKISVDRFKDIMNSKKPLVKKLALDIGLGGVYAEELCARVKIDKDKENIEISEIKKLYESLNSMISSKIEAYTVYDDKDNTKLIDITPFKLEIYKEKTNERCLSLNECYDKLLTKKLKSSLKEESLTHHTEKIGKQEKILIAQSKRLAEMEKEIEELNKKAELIFSNYSFIEEVINQIKEETKKTSLVELRKKLKSKDHKVLKDIIPKEKKIVLEL